MIRDLQLLPLILDTDWSLLLLQVTLALSLSLSLSLGTDYLPSPLHPLALRLHPHPYPTPVPTLTPTPQGFTGDITLSPPLTLADYAAVVSDPTLPAMRRYLEVGRREVWRKLPMLNVRTRLDDALADPRSEVGPNLGSDLLLGSHLGSDLAGAANMTMSSETPTRRAARPARAARSPARSGRGS